MKTAKQQIFDIIKFFILFYITSVLLQLTYSISFYISDIVHIFNAPLKISFIFAYSVVLGLYFTFHVLYNVKVMRVLCFLSVLFSMFYLQDFHGNILFKQIFSAEISYFLFILYLIAGGNISADQRAAKTGFGQLNIGIRRVLIMKDAVRTLIGGFSAGYIDLISPLEGGGNQGNTAVYNAQHAAHTGCGTALAIAALLRGSKALASSVP